ncbi:uncharacterized protein [Paralichthys olivaceus]|uniref:uncharacterized protein isoform X2 n=1 Tax=Paralichthys olivaceus TaxID=8255 RepID=UPI003753BBE0
MSQSNTEQMDGFTTENIMEMEMDDKELLDSIWAVVHKVSKDTNTCPLPQDVPAQEWHDLFSWSCSDEGTPPIESHRSLEQHPTEPHAELNDQQQSVLQSGPQFSHAGPHNQTQENNNERDGYRSQNIINLREEFDLTEEEQNDKEVQDIVCLVFNKLLRDTNNHPPPQNVPAQEQQSVLQSGPQFSQAGPHNQTQFNNVPAVKLTKHLEVRLAPIGLFHGKVIYGAPGDRVPSPMNHRHSQKRKRESQQEDEMPYVKLSKTEQTLSAVAEPETPDCGALHPKFEKKFNNVPAVELTKHLEVRLAPIGLFQGKVIYGAPGDRVPSPMNHRHSQKRKRESQQEDEMPYVKLSKKEQAINAVAEPETPDCGALHPKFEKTLNNVPAVTKHLEVRLAPIGLFHGKVIYGAPGDRVPSPMNHRHSQKRKLESQQEDEMPYSKLSKKEQALNAVSELETPDCGALHPEFEKKLNNVPAVTKHLEVRLAPIGLFHGKVIYGAPGDRVPSPMNHRHSQKRKRESQEELETPDCVAVNTLMEKRRR